jgi:hypothetical protein
VSKRASGGQVGSAALPFGLCVRPQFACTCRTMPRAQLTREQQLQQLAEQRRALESGELASSPASKAGAPAAKTPQQGLRDYPNFRMGRVFLQHLPFKTYASTFAYVSPKEGPQAKYGLFPSRFRR